MAAATNPPLDRQVSSLSSQGPVGFPAGEALLVEEEEASGAAVWVVALEVASAEEVSAGVGAGVGVDVDVEVEVEHYRQAAMAKGPLRITKRTRKKKTKITVPLQKVCCRAIFAK